jgi:hypothetical protein
MLFFLSSIFFLLQNQIKGGQNRFCPGREGLIGTSERGEMVGIESKGVNIVQKSLHMCVNAKIIPVETIP